MPAHSPLRIGMLGCGTVGWPLLQMVRGDPHAFDVRFVVVRDPRQAKHERLRGTATLSGRQFDDQLDQRLAEVDVVVEVMGPSKQDPDDNSEAALVATKNRIADILAAQKSVVTANKAVMSRWGRELIEIARRAGGDGAAPGGGVVLKFEAAVCGSIPIIRLLRDHWRGQNIRRLIGILNGTCNFVLTKMEQFEKEKEAVQAEFLSGSTNPALSWACAQADAAGLMEPKPEGAGDVAEDLANADLSGSDAADKLAILAAMAFGVDVDPTRHILKRPINHVTLHDIRFCDQMNYAIKQLAVADLAADNRLRLSVQPTLIPKYHPLASVSGEYNAVYVQSAVQGDHESGHFGDQLYYGKGAGVATATAVFADLLDIAQGHVDNVEFARSAAVTCVPDDEHEFVGYIRSVCQDVPGVFRAKTAILAKHDVSVEQIINLPTFRQAGDSGPALVPDMILVDQIPFRQIKAALDSFEATRLDENNAQSPRLSVTKPLFLPIAKDLEDHNDPSHQPASLVSPHWVPFKQQV